MSEAPWVAFWPPRSDICRVYGLVFDNIRKIKPEGKIGKTKKIGEISASVVQSYKETEKRESITLIPKVINQLWEKKVSDGGEKRNKKEQKKKMKMKEI